MERTDLVPERHRAERLFLLALLGPEPVPANVAVDPSALAAAIPKPLHPYIYWRLRDLPALRAPFEASYRENAMRHLRRMAELRRIDQALKSADIPYLLLKGPILAATVYP